MSRRTLGGTARLAAVLTVALVANDTHRARAWDSICYEWPDPTKPVEQLGTPSGRGCEAMVSARGRWRDPVWQLDEHRVVLRYAIDHGGLPAAILDTVVLAVPTLDQDVDTGGGRMMPQLWPVSLDAVTLVERLARRGFAIDELAQLPDFSYSLADWAGGNERCPVPELAEGGLVLGGSRVCHTFASHMGALNSSHFAPQSDRWYRWMHDLARTRADQCTAMRAQAWTGFATPAEATAFDHRWYDVWRECEVEALALEAVAQHYLQDSWSSGHMWQRWGSSTLADFPATVSTDTAAAGPAWNAVPPEGRRLMIAELVALFAGTIHGSDPVLFEKSLTTAYVPAGLADAVCYPADETIGYMAAGVSVPAAGDMHLHDVLGDALSRDLFGRDADTLHDQYDSSLTSSDHTASLALHPQQTALLGCAAASVREIYDHLGGAATFGTPTFGPVTGAAPAAPASCDAPRLSARALATGVEDATFASLKFRVAVDGGAVLAEVPTDIEAAAFHSYDETRRVVQLLAKSQPTSTAAADLAWTAFDYDERRCVWDQFHRCQWTLVHVSEPAGELRFLGVGANGQYAIAPGGRPGRLADPPLPWGDPEQPAALVDDSPEQVLASAFNRAHAPLWCARTSAAELTLLEDRTKAALPADRPALCQVCTEVVARHVRPGTDGKSLCEVLHPGSVTLAGAADPTQVAEDLCGCTDHVAAIAESGLTFMRTDPTGEITSLSGAYPAGSLIRDAVAASRNRIFITNGQGDVVGFRWHGGAAFSATVIDLVPTDPATRFHLGGDPRGVAFVQSLGKDYLLVVDNATDLLRVYDLGDQDLEKFELCSTLDVGRDPTRVEGTWDLVVKADGSKAYISIRGGTSTPGDAMAMVDLPELLSCDNVNPPVTHVYGFGGTGLGAMAFSPDQQHLAVAARGRNTCLDRVYSSAAGTTTVDVQVGCDMIFVLRVAALAPGPLAAAAKVSFGARTNLPTRPLMFPYAVAWHPDGTELAYGSFSSLSPWPQYGTANMNAQGAIALGTIGTPRFPPANAQVHWSYSAPVGGAIGGESVVFTGDGQFVLVGALDGKVYSFPAAPTHDFWQHRDSDPETALHAGATLGSWYGGCRVAVTNSCPGGFCPVNCPMGSAPEAPAGSPPLVKTLQLASPVRKLLRL